MHPAARRQVGARPTTGMVGTRAAAVRSTGVEVHALRVIVHDVNALRRVATGNRRSRRDFLMAGR